MADKKPKPFNQNASIRGALRRLFARSPLIRACLHKVRREVPKYNKDGSLAKRPAVQYLCSVCDTWTKSTKISVDHIDPVISTNDGFIDWNTYIQRLFCGEENLQVICDTCHQAKTNEERAIRLSLEYTAELDLLAQQLSVDPKAVRKALTKYVSKGKVKGLEEIAARAKSMRDSIPAR